MSQAVTTFSANVLENYFSKFRSIRQHTWVPQTVQSLKLTFFKPINDKISFRTSFNRPKHAQCNSAQKVDKLGTSWLPK